MSKHGMSEEEYRELMQNLFEAYDTNASGAIEKSEVKQILIEHSDEIESITGKK